MIKYGVKECNSNNGVSMKAQSILPFHDFNGKGHFLALMYFYLYTMHTNKKIQITKCTGDWEHVCDKKDV